MPAYPRKYRFQLRFPRAPRNSAVPCHGAAKCTSEPVTIAGVNGSAEKRRALRILLNVPALITPVGMPEMNLHENLAKVYERVSPSDDMLGKKLPGVIRDLSTNGAFIAGEPLPLLSRVAMAFPLEGFGQVEVLAWTLWRRTKDCEIPGAEGRNTKLTQGFGVLFEAIPLQARLAIHKLVQNAASNVS